MEHARVPINKNAVSNILIVDDHPLYSDALEQALHLIFPESAMRTATTLGEALELGSESVQPDLIMFDLKLPDVTGISGFLRLRRQMPEAKILVISSLASYELVQSLLDQGASGFLPKDTPAQGLRLALAEITAGRRYVPTKFEAPKHRAREAAEWDFEHPSLGELTPQQKRIMQLICCGKPNKQIAFELSLAEATVKAHITALLRRLGVQNRTQAVVLVEGAFTAMHGDEPAARAYLNH